MISPADRHDTMRAAGLFAAASTIVVCLLWLPFGFGMVGHIEEWDILSQFTRHGVFFFAGEDSPLASHRLRPLTAAPNAVAYLLTPDSFIGMHFLQMGALIGKGVAGAFLGYWLLRSRLSAVLLGLLVIVFPADTMQLSFRSFHINWAVALGMAGVAGLVYAYDRRESGRRGALLLAILSSLSLAISIQIYEVALVFVPFPYLLLWARQGLRGTIRVTFAQFPVTLAWAVAVMACLIYIYTVLRHGATYQSNVLGGQSTNFDALKERVATFLYIGMGRSIFAGWSDAVMILIEEYRTYLYLLACTVVIALVLVVSTRWGLGAPRQAMPEAPSRLFALRVILVGLVMTGLGYLPFLSSPAHLAISQRIFLFSTFGAALTTVAVLWLVFHGRSSRWIAAAGTGLIALGLSAQMFQFHHYQQISDGEREVLGEIVTTLPSIAPGSNVVILDGSQRISSFWLLRDNMFHALTYIYGTPVNSVQTCTAPSNAWQKIDRFGRPGRCVKIPGGWAFVDGPAASAPGEEAREPKLRIESKDEDTQIVRIPANASSTPDVAYLHGADPLSRRYRGVIVDRAWPLGFNQFQSSATSDSFRWDVARWWNLDVPVHGVGWRDGEWQNGGRFMKRSFSWSNLPDASLRFELAPRNTPYEVEGRIVSIAPGTDRNSLSISINGSERIPLSWISDKQFRATIPAGTMIHGSNEAVMHIPVDAHFFGIGLAVDWIKFTPKQ